MTAEVVASPTAPARTIRDLQPLPAQPVPHLGLVEAPRAVRSLAVLGDSAPAGVGDPVPGGGWRGFGPLLHDSLGGAHAVRYANLSSLGARMACVRREQLPAALEMAPDVAVVLVGMNDTLRSDFDPAQLRRDYEAVVGSLRACGTTVLTVRFHDHSRVFWMPGPLRRALRQRIAELNAVIDAVVAGHGIGCLDLDLMPGGYDRETWSVDRLHPSELGHRMLADNFGVMLESRGYRVVCPVSLDSQGGREITVLHRVLWLLFKGLPWLASRGHDLVTYALSVLARELWRAVTRADSHRADSHPADSHRTDSRRAATRPGPRASRRRRSAS